MILTHSPDRPGGDPNPSHPVDLDLPTLGRLVRAEAQDLVETAASVNDELQLLSGSTDGEWAGDSLGRKDEVPRSPDEIIASLNGIGAAAYRLARHVRTLVEFQAPCGVRSARQRCSSAPSWPTRRHRALAPPYPCQIVSRTRIASGGRDQVLPGPRPRSPPSLRSRGTFRIGRPA